MNKWIAIPVIVVLAVVIIGGGYFLLQQNNKLTEAESEIVSLEGNVATLEGNVSSLEGNVATLETNLANSEATVATLESDLETANADLETANAQASKLQSDVSAQRNINSKLSSELKTVKSPRHFSSIQELTDWLQEDDTDKKYADESDVERSYILQVRALRDGYILGIDMWLEGRTWHGINFAVIGDNVHAIYSEDDDTERNSTAIQPVPSKPLP